MKNRKINILRNMLKNILVYTIMIACITVSSVKAIEPSKPSELEKAKETICEFKGIIKEFFNKKNNETYRQHLQKFAKILASIELLESQVSEKYEQTESSKDKAFLELLGEIKENTKAIYYALNQKYKTVLSLALALGKVFKKYASEAHLDKLKDKFESLKEHLTEEEAAQLAEIMDILENIADGIPKSKLTCLSRLNKIWKRKTSRSGNRRGV
ncbi:hypothetical protein ACFLYU_05575 [Candidatus Dependentiae bacterium]